MCYLFRYTRASMASNKDRLESFERKLQANILDFLWCACTCTHTVITVHVFN